MISKLPGVSVYIPGLLGPIPAESSDLLSKLPVLSRLLSRAKQSLADNLFRILTAEEKTPVAALSYLADFGVLPETEVVCCDPVYLQADLGQAFLFDTHSFRISNAEAGKLVEAFNTHFHEFGLNLCFKHPQRWYLAADKAPGLNTLPLQRISGKNIDPYLPAGNKGAEYWNRILNETQMLFYQHPVNTARESSGQTPINGVWIYGAGDLGNIGNINLDKIYTDSAISKGLAAYINIGCHAPAENFNGLKVDIGEQILLHTDQLHNALAADDFNAWADLLIKYEQNWFAPLWKQVKAKQIKQVIIGTGDTNPYIMTAASARRFWRPVKTFSTFVAIKNN